jgi:hypothetical protein
MKLSAVDEDAIRYLTLEGKGEHCDENGMGHGV